MAQHLHQHQPTIKHYISLDTGRYTKIFYIIFFYLTCSLKALACKRHNISSVKDDKQESLKSCCYLLKWIFLHSSCNLWIHPHCGSVHLLRLFLQLRVPGQWKQRKTEYFERYEYLVCAGKCFTLEEFEEAAAGKKECLWCDINSQMIQRIILFTEESSVLLLHNNINIYCSPASPAITSSLLQCISISSIITKEYRHRVKKKQIIIAKFCVSK